MRRRKSRPEKPNWRKLDPEGYAQRTRDYRAYLKSATWRAVRGAAIYRAGGACEHCRGTEYLQVHHVKYPRVFGEETPEMLRVLCDPCHAEEHGRPYLIHKLSREKRQARRERIKEIKPPAREAKRAKRLARGRKWNPAPTPSLKDRFGTIDKRGDTL